MRAKAAGRVPAVTDRFASRVAELAGLTVRRLRETQEKLRECGLDSEAASLEALIREHAEVACDCFEDTAVHHPRTPPGGQGPTDR